MYIGYEKSQNNLAFIRVVSSLDERFYPELEYVEAEYIEPQLKDNQIANAYWDKEQQKVVWNIITLQRPSLEEETLMVTQQTKECVEGVGSDSLITIDMALQLNEKLDTIISHLGLNN